jgi:hypothetical protein
MIFEAVNRWVLHYAKDFNHEELIAVQYAHLFLWLCCLQLTLALSSGSIGEGAEHSLGLEQWVIADAMRADYGTPVTNSKGEYDESVVRNRTGTKSVMQLNGIEVPVEKKSMHLEQRRRRMKCWGTLLAHMCAFAAIHTGGTLQHSVYFASSPAMSLMPLFINQLFIHIIFGVFKALRNAVSQQAAAEGRQGLRAALFEEYASHSENEVSCLGCSFLLVQSLRYWQMGELPSMIGHVEGTPWSCICALMISGVVMITISVVLILIKSRYDVDESSFFGRFWQILIGSSGMSFAWCWLFGSRQMCRLLPILDKYGLGMASISGRVVLAIVVSLILMALIFGLDTARDMATRGALPGKNPGREIVAALVFAKSILVGFSWEHSFEGGVEAIASITSSPLYTQSVLAVFMFLIVVPSWRRHILRKSLILEDYRLKQDAADMASGYTPVPSTSPRHPGSVTTDRNSPPANIRSEADKVYSALPTEPPEDRSSRPNGESGTVTKWPKEVSACLGMAKAINILGGLERKQPLALEKTSVYGAAIAIPQIARSARWPKSMCGLALRSYLFVLLNYFVQTLFVYYIYDSQTNMNPFGGQMHLCDFASHISSCPNGPDCTGPGGQAIPDPGALYPFDIWYTRGFMRDSLQQLFPDKLEEIQNKVDPGEYGLESYYCRLLCIFVFVLQIADEFQNIHDLFRFLKTLPSGEADEAPWIQYDIPPGESKPKDDAHGNCELEFVKFSVNSMPVRWKIINIVFLLIPRIFIWRMVTMARVHFLMETAAMVDQIVNTTALSFVLTTDELILERLATKATKHMMANIEEQQLFDYTPYTDETDQQALERYDTQEMSWRVASHSFPLLPKRLLWTVLLMAFFTAEYYVHNCTQAQDGGWVSKDMYLPEHAHLSFSNFVMKFFSLSHEAHSADPVWSMPERV